MALLALVAAAIVIAFLVLGGGDDGLKKTDTIQVGAGPAALVVAEGSVWVANADGGTLSRVNADSKKVAGPARVGGRTTPLRGFR